jgi:predicted small lipoprotein YifL
MSRPSALPAAIAAIMLALFLGACGVRGALEPPPGAPPPSNDPFALDPLIK